MGGGLVFTGMPRRREVLGTGIIRWTKVVNPDGTVTWQEATTSSGSKKEEKPTTIEKQPLERPSWIKTRKESEVRGHKRRATVAEDSEHKDKKVETRPTRAFSFQTTEKNTGGLEKTAKIEEVRFATPVSSREDKRGSVAGLASKFGSTVEAVSPARNEVETPKKEPVKTPKNETAEIQSAHPVNPPSLPKEETNTFENAFRSHWSKQEDIEPKQESDAELAARLANTEKIFRQQEKKIQAALDRIKDLERQLVSGFSTNTSDQDDVQSKASWDNSSIAAGGIESGPHFRRPSTISANANAKGPLPFSRDDDPHYRVLTVNSNKPEVCAGDYHASQTGTYEVEGSRTPSPIAVDVNIPAARDSEPSTANHQLPITTSIEIPKRRLSATKPQVTNTPTLKSYPPLTRSNTTKSNSNTPTTAATKHKPLPLLPVDARIKPSSVSGPKLSPPLHFPPNLGAKPSLCIGSGRPRPPRSVSSFKKMHKIRPLTPIPEEPCSLKRRPRVPRRRSRSSLRRVSTNGECGLVRSGSGRSQRSGHGIGGGEGGGRGRLERWRTN